MYSIRIKNLRCLSDTGFIQIKPITVLLGQNSSGKSTFLRVLPLLKQSVESRTTGPILWTGRLVDFGVYEDAHRKNAQQGILFSFKFQSDLFYPYTRSKLVYTKEYLESIEIRINLEILKIQETNKLSSLSIFFADSTIEMEFGEDEYLSKFYVNNENFLGTETKYRYQQLSNSHILPIITEYQSEIDSASEEIESLPIYIRGRLPRFRKIPDMLKKETKRIAHSSTSETTIQKMALSFGLGSSEEMLKDIQNNKYAGKSWKKRTKDWTIDTDSFKRLRNLIIANAVPLIIEDCDSIIGKISRQIRYMGPVRAIAERYYRTQDLAVDEVDYQGRNLSMFLRNLTESEMKNFADWTFRNFGFKPSIKSSLGHISIEIIPRDSDKPVNVADTGFGFSQLLPIITQLWLLCEAPERRAEGNLGRQTSQTPVVFAIEQPELHLHPRLQGILTDVLVASVKAAKDKNINFRLVIETHSEVLVNRLGHLVADKKINAEDINIVLFEPSNDNESIITRTSKFDSDGYLIDWPLGFFEMEFE
ncbi:MAG: AAA family ATPase [Coleofasciculus chthonoplastes F3-SA18-01]|uniref:AAA family ATPase n=1 Tax=Coleofasciculus chthonoplastes TaxID=64178 RepID=UPI0032F9343A